MTRGLRWLSCKGRDEFVQFGKEKAGEAGNSGLQNHENDQWGECRKCHSPNPAIPKV